MRPMQSPSPEEVVTVKRGKFLTLLQTALAQRELQFVRQACLVWLASYPGDLLVNFVYATALSELGDKNMAKASLEKTIKYDPEFTEAVSLLSQLDEGEAANLENNAALNYLQRGASGPQPSAAWFAPLQAARHAYESGDLVGAEKQILAALAYNPSNPLPASFHMQVVRDMGNYTLLETLAGIYSSRWPDCLQIKIFSAIAAMQIGEDGEAVEKLHWTAAHDVSGQVVNRILGPNHPYKPLWPEDLKVYLDLPVPASVATELGWNVLSTAQPGSSMDVPQIEQTQRVGVGKNITTADLDLIGNPTLKTALPDYLQEESSEIPPDPNVDYSEVPTSSFFLNEIATPPSAAPETMVEDLEEQQAKQKAVTELTQIQAEFDKVARSIKKSDLLTADGRFPSYVLVTSRLNLESKYGANTANVIIDAMNDLSLKITALPNWNSVVLVPDDPKCMSELGLTAISSADAWKIKLALADLDKKLAQKGEMVGALLIVGGHEVVPFHMLPNPTDDSDINVPSDNPYATTDENYFIQQWPVGRIPDEKGADAVFLLEQLRFLNNEYSLKVNAKTIITGTVFEQWLFALIDLFSQSAQRARKSENIGYSAEVWKVPSSEVYSLIDSASRINLSPPIDSSNFMNGQKPNPKFAYFNLHGLQDAPEWYGQRDYRTQSRDPEYPIAVSPEAFTERTGAPEMVFSEACYGANILEKQAIEAMSLNFLANGTRAFVGSTCIAYGSVNKPLIAADLLAHDYWTHVINGVSAGYALMRAKMTLARNMTENQGYLDGEDQKTILSFVLYGDPLASQDNLKRYTKPMIRPSKNPNMKTISDSREELVVSAEEMPTEILEKVRKVISSYLPGLDDATVTLSPQLTNFTLDPNHIRARKSRQDTVQDSQRYVVTLKKSYMMDSINHDHFARMTFDQKGEMIKLSSSR